MLLLILFLSLTISSPTSEPPAAPLLGPLSVTSPLPNYLPPNSLNPNPLTPPDTLDLLTNLPQTLRTLTLLPGDCQTFTLTNRHPTQIAELQFVDAQNRPTYYGNVTATFQFTHPFPEETFTLTADTPTMPLSPGFVATGRICAEAVGIQEVRVTRGDQSRTARIEVARPRTTSTTTHPNDPASLPITLSPNPATTDWVQIHFPAPLTYQLYTPTGRLLATGTNTISTTNLPAGTYPVVIQTQQGRAVRQLIIR